MGAGGGVDEDADGASCAGFAGGGAVVVAAGLSVRLHPAAKITAPAQIAKIWT